MPQKIQAILTPTRRVVTLAQAIRDIEDGAEGMQRFYMTALMKRAVPYLPLFESAPADSLSNGRVTASLVQYRDWVVISDLDGAAQGAARP